MNSRKLVNQAATAKSFAEGVLSLPCAASRRSRGFAGGLPIKVAQLYSASAKFDISVSRWTALLGLVAVLLADVWGSFPLKPRQEYGLVLLVLMFGTVVVVALVLMPRAAGTLVGSKEVFAPFVLFLCAERVLGWLARLPGLSAVFSPALPLRLLHLSFSISLHFVLSIALAVGYATWITATVLALVHSGIGDPCAVMPAALRKFWRVLGLEFIGWVVVFIGLGTLLWLMPFVGAFALAPMLVFVVGWNLATAAVLPVAWDSGPGFAQAFRAGVRVSLANLRQWWVLLLAQMLLLGLVTFFASSWRDGGGQHRNANWSVNAFWTGGYENECRWYGKMAETYHTSQVPLVQTGLALLLGALAVAIKIAIVQRLQPDAPPIIEPPGTEATASAT